MREKLTIEEFRRFKEEFKKLINESSSFYDEHKDDENFDSNAFEQEITNRYLDLQNRLISYDLSLIPFEEWKDLDIVGDKDHVVDMSNTHANLDFNIIYNQSFINCKGCNVRNIQRKYLLLDENLFDREVVLSNPSLFIPELSNNEVRNKILNHDLTMEDLFLLEPSEIEILKTKDLSLAFDYRLNSFIDDIGLNRAIDLYRYSIDDFNYVSQFSSGQLSGYYYSEPDKRQEYINKIRECSIENIRKEANDFYRKAIFDDRYSSFFISDFSEEFKRENPDLFLLDESIPDDLRQRYYNKNLTIDDLLDNIQLFKEIPFARFMDYSKGYKDLLQVVVSTFGYKHSYEFISAYPDLFEYLAKGGFETLFVNYVNNNSFEVDPLSEQDLTDAFKTYLNNFFNANPKLATKEQLLLYKPEYHNLEANQKRLVDFLGLDNIKKFEMETEFFSHKNNHYYRTLDMLDATSAIIQMHGIDTLKNNGIDFKDGTLSYEEFKDVFAKLLDYMRKHNVFTDYENYGWMRGEFRDKHSEIFMSLDAPSKMIEDFYKNRINPEYIRQNREAIPYLIDKNLFNTIRVDMKLVTPIDDYNSNEEDFVKWYLERFGNEKFLDLCVKYGNVLNDLRIVKLDHEPTEEEINHELMNAIYNRIVNGSVKNYGHLSEIPEFVNNYPDLFIDFDQIHFSSEEEKSQFIKDFYSKGLSFDDIRKYSELQELLRDKNLGVIFESGTKLIYRQSTPKTEMDLLKFVGNENFLELCRRYGNCLKNSSVYLASFYDFNNGTFDFDELAQKIEEYITTNILAGDMNYSDETIPDFLRKSHPELLLSEDAPEDLKKYFYKYGSNYIFTFEELSKHKDWVPYLKGKAVKTALCRNSYLKRDILEYFNVFGEEKALKLGFSRGNTVGEMIRAHKVGLMKSWYDKTGGKFVPDYIVMLNFDINEVDKFLSSGVNWSNLMKIKEFANNPDGRDAMLKLAYSFGAFDQDQRGYKKLIDLLTGIPRTIKAEQGYIIKKLTNHTDFLANREELFKKGLSPKEIYNQIHMSILSRSKEDIDDTEKSKIANLFQALDAENVNIDFSKDIFTQLYRANEDGSYTLIINPQNYPKTASAIRDILSEYREIPILTSEAAHHYMGGFRLQYDPDFREFFLANYQTIMANADYLQKLPAIQHRFKEIKTIYSNVALTVDLAISFVDTNKYENISVGSEGVAKAASIQNYSQSDFEKIQRIYNYGRQRVFSSIPRIKSDRMELSSGTFTYEILRLDDARAMSIGFESDCCQRLGEPAELCMEHSMVDKNGRVFVIKDELGNIVAQSWVWRNKDVLCFDNIEIPSKAFDRSAKEHPEVSRKGFTDEIYGLYKRAAHDLIEADEKAYRKLLEEGKITREQYDGLRLGKITVGLGYNDIASSLKQNATLDTGALSRPLPFTEPVKLSRGLYTSDSTTQYILEEREDRTEVDAETLSIHGDESLIYTDDNFNQTDLLSLQRLEIETNGGYKTRTGGTNTKQLVSEIASNYGLDGSQTRIVMNPNFAIIYEENGDFIKLADLFYKTKLYDENGELDIENAVLLQIRRALDQIKGNKKVFLMNLDEEQKSMYERAMGLTSEIDKERGLM